MKILTAITMLIGCSVCCGLAEVYFAKRGAMVVSMLSGGIIIWGVLWITDSFK